jgi:hypothetical protein
VSDDPRATEISPVELAKLAWQDYQYKHGVFWKTFYSGVTAYAAVLVAPLLNSGNAGFNRYVLLFPVLALGTCWLTFWIMRAEHLRAARAERVFRNLLSRNLVAIKVDYVDAAFPGVFGKSIGRVVSMAWLVGGTLLGLLAVVLMSSWTFPALSN